MAILSLVISGAGWIAAVLAAAGSIYTAMTAALVLRFFDARRSAPLNDTEVAASQETVSLLKPLHGAEAGLRQNLAAHFLQKVHNSPQIVFGLQRVDDPAGDVARSLMALYPSAPAVIAVGGRPGGVNRKVANLIQMFPHATGQVMVITDSDIRPPPDHLGRVLRALGQPGVGVVTCPYLGSGETGFWSDVAAAGLNHHFLPNVIAGVSLGMARPCMGSTIALRRETLERIGGFEAFRDLLADDYAMGAAVRALGLESVVAPSLVAHSCTERTLAEVFRHELRWARTVRSVDPAGHAGSVVTHPLPLALLAVALTRISPATLAILIGAIVARFLLAATIDRRIGAPRGLPWLLPARDMLSFAVFGASFLGRAVEWRGEKFHVTTNGDLSPV